MTDSIHISAAGFGGGLSADVTPALDAGADLPSSHAAGGYFFYDNSGTGSGTVYWDPTGSDSSDAIAFAKVAAGAALVATDFLIV